MTKRFKGKRAKKSILRRLFLYLILIYIFFNLTYNLIYNLYLSHLSNQDIINRILSDTKNNSSSFILKFTKPENIVENNFYLKEPESETINVSEEKESTIYIYNTHETESYNASYLEFYNIKPTVKTASYILKDYLSDLGIESIVENRSVSAILKNNNWNYKYSYEASRELIYDIITQNDYKLIIDLHRDSTSFDKTHFIYNNKSYAKILFVVGKEHDSYLYNYQLAETLNNLLEESVPGISRGISLKSGEGVNGIYNQDLSKNMVLIEVGGQYNEIEEVNNTISVLSQVILKYLERNL